MKTEEDHLETDWSWRRGSRFTLALWLVVSLIATPLLAGQEIPGADDGTPVVIRGATIHVGNGKVIEDGAITIVDGKIGAVGPAAQIKTPANGRVIEFNGDRTRHLYPGFIDADTTLGLIEIEAVRATRDTAETGELNPNAKAQIAFNPDSELIPVARADGVLLALVVPRGRLLRGQSALMMLDGWTSDDMALVPSVGMHLSWPNPVRMRSWDDDESAEERLKKHREQLQRINTLFDQTDVYRAGRTAGSHDTKYDPRLDALVPVVAGELPLFVHANDIRQIDEAIAFAVERNVKLVIVGGYDAELAAPLLKEHKIPVIVTGTHRLPRHRHAQYDEPFTLPARLTAAGIRYCLAGNDRFSAAGVRNLTQHAGTAVAFGLDKEQAVRAITLSAAEILGVADRIGSIETGKEATLIVSNGDVLELDSNVTHAFLLGRPVDLDNRHKRLYRKYKLKYERQAEQN